MPELPEVQTTVDGLKAVLPGLKITGVWTDLAVKKPSRKDYQDTLKSLDFFKRFKKEVSDQKIVSVRRRAKNILIDLSNKKTILIHLKMTGNLLYGHYEQGERFVHVIFYLSNGKMLAFRDMRKFGKVTLLQLEDIEKLKIGPEPLEKNFQFSSLKSRLLKKPNGKIKTVLMDQSVIAGIGNIYSDEILWLAGAHPEERVKNISNRTLMKIFRAMKLVLKKGVNFGGDSTSDYRNIYDQKGRFQLHHKAYQRKGEKCGKIGCKGFIIRKIVGGRSAHFCSVHQKLRCKDSKN